MSKSGFLHKSLPFLILFFIITHLYSLDTNEIDTLKSNLRGSKDSIELNILQDLTRKYLFKSSDSCIKYGTLAVNLAQELQDIEQEASALKKMGYACQRIGNYDQSIHYYERALKSYLKLNQYLDAAVITNFLGNAYCQLSDYARAMDYFTSTEISCDSLVISSTDKRSVKRLYSILYTNIGLLYHELDSIHISLGYFTEALQYAEEISDSTRITASYSNIGMVLKNQEKYEMALTKYNQALQIARMIGNHDYEIAILNNIANIYLYSGTIDSSQYYYVEAKRLILQTGDKYGLSLVNRNIASIYIKSGNYSESIRLFNEALALAKEVGNLKEVYSCYEGLSEAYRNMGDYNKAYSYHTKFTLLKDSVSGIETRERIADIHTKYETEKKEKENISLRKNNEIQQLQLSGKNLLIFFLVSGIFGFLVLSVMIYIQYRKRNIAYKQLVEKNLDLINSENKSLFNPASNTNRDENNDNHDQLKNLARAFDDYMKKEKAFLYSEICYDEVCKKLNTNRTYLSKAINETYNKSFTEVINIFRIKEASLYLSDSKYNHLSIEGIGQMTGFNYKAAFYSNFKKQVGITPSFFRKNSQA